MSSISVWSLSIFVVSSFDWYLYIFISDFHEHHFFVEEDLTHFNLYFLLFNPINLFLKMKLIFWLKNHTDDAIKLLPFTILEISPSPVQVLNSFEYLQLFTYYIKLLCFGIFYIPPHFWQEVFYFLFIRCSFIGIRLSFIGNMSGLNRLSVIFAIII